MIFNSFSFLIFFPVVTLLYFLFPYRFRWSLLLSASCFFYMFFKPEYILILFFTIIIDYFAGIYIEKTSDKRRKRNLLIISLISNIGILFFFKYFNFFNENITGLAELFGYKNLLPSLNIILPIGLSFHTFQAISYTIEVYKGNQKAEKHFGIYALYVMFYPQLVAGPIERPQNVLYQFHEKKYLMRDNLLIGLNFIVLGFFKKVVVADRLSLYVNEVYDHIDFSSSISVVIAVFFFSLQIYCDFSGYSDIAIGTARIMGFDLMQNFNRPYLSKSVSEFWTRWHISLSTWFRDYVYIPLGGSKVSEIKIYRNLLIIFLLSGLWHGANWTFILWGLLNGIYLVTERLIKKNNFFNKVKIGAIGGYLSIVFTFTLISFTWIFFRAENVGHAKKIINKLIHQDMNFNFIQLFANKGPLNFMLSLLVILLLAISYNLPKDLKLKRNTFFIILVSIIILFIGKNGESEFIYFQF